MPNMSGMQKSAANKLLQKRNIPMPMLQKEIPMKGLKTHWYNFISESSDLVVFVLLAITKKVLCTLQI